MFIVTLFISSPAMADFAYSQTSSYAQEMLRPGDTIIDDEDDIVISDDVGEDFGIAEPISDQASDIVAPTKPIDPFAPAPPVTQKAKKKILKKIPRLDVKRSIADDRIDDGYVQELIKQKFDFNNQR